MIVLQCLCYSVCVFLEFLLGFHSFFDLTAFAILIIGTIVIDLFDWYFCAIIFLPQRESNLLLHSRDIINYRAFILVCMTLLNAIACLHCKFCSHK